MARRRRSRGSSMGTGAGLSVATGIGVGLGVVVGVAIAARLAQRKPSTSTLVLNSDGTTAPTGQLVQTVSSPQYLETTSVQPVSYQPAKVAVAELSPFDQDLASTLLLLMPTGPMNCDRWLALDDATRLSYAGEAVAQAARVGTHFGKDPSRSAYDQARSVLDQYCAWSRSHRALSPAPVSRVTKRAPTTALRALGIYGAS